MAERTPRTSPTLLGRLARLPTDEAAWAEFAERYGRKIYGWCRWWRLQEADAEDVTQQVLIKLARQMRTFAYDPARSFRGWLKTVVHNAWRDFLDSRRNREIGSGDTQILELLQTVEARDHLVSQLDDEFARDLLDEAMARVQARVQPHTWEAFRLLVFEQLSGAEVAKRLNMKVATAFVAKSKVQRMLQEEMRRLGHPDTTPSGDCDDLSAEGPASASARRTSC
jgi:RNA polymerase sigma-70 factor (ECF subfamily)